MQRRIDKTLLYTGCSILFYLSVYSIMALIPMGIVLVLLFINSFVTQKTVPIITFISYLILCCFFPLFSIFLPVLLYDLLFRIYRFFALASILPFAIYFDTIPKTFLILSIFFIILSVILYSKTSAIEQLGDEYNTFRKTSHELAVVQSEKQQSLLENQDYAIETAILNERNRISQDIHDHVGHLLSRSLLQIGALLTITKEPVVRESLELLKQSISEGMDSIRASIHNMHEESLDLRMVIKEITDEFTFCPIIFSYHIHGQPSVKIKYAFIAIVKEALANIIKHSDADKVSVTLNETERDYCLEVADNGTISDDFKITAMKYQASKFYGDGMGLQNMYNRSRSFQGTFQITTEQGFTIHITIPKEDITA